MEIKKELKVVASIEIITAIALMLSWMIYLALNQNLMFFPFDKLAFKNCFPFLDVLFVGLLMIAGIQLFKGNPKGKTISFICAALMIFLGGTDYGFNHEGESYAISMIDMVSKGFVNLWCTILGLFIFITLRKKPE